jgi:membrane protein implicated in regulation of membrane protease activity
MIVIGLLLIAIAVLILAGLLLAPGSSAEVEFFGLILPNLSARTLVLSGLLLGLVAALGLSLVRAQLRQWRRIRERRRSRPAPAGAAGQSDEDPFLLGS